MIRLLAGDCRGVLATLPADGVQCVVTSPPYYALRSYLDASHPDKHREIGSEPTPDEYLATMVGVFREVRRVMRPDATCWVNMGDSFCDKQLLMMPARLALALQADGWWVRSDIIWHKPNPMPESVTDRPTSAHEHVFLLTKSARYYYDADAVREAQETASPDHPSYRAIVQAGRGSPNGVERQMLRGQQFGVRTTSLVKELDPRGRNLRNVWTIATAPYSEAHFATFPPALAERCIKAGTSERGCCSQCGQPWVRVTERQTVRQLADAQGTWAERPAAEGYGNAAMTTQRRDATSGLSASNSHNASTPQSPLVTTTGWRAGCDHDAPVVPCTVLDPFAGAGTTLLVADRLQRDAIGVELNVEYTRMAMQRCRDDAPLFADMPPAADPEDARIADLFAEAAE